MTPLEIWKFSEGKLSLSQHRSPFEHHTIPKNVKFSKIDPLLAYFHFKLEEDCRYVTPFLTPFPVLAPYVWREIGPGNIRQDNEHTIGWLAFEEFLYIYTIS